MRRVLLALLAGISSTFSQAGEDTADLKLVLRTDKAVHAPSEPVVLRYWIENVSQRPVSIPRLIGPSEGWIQLEVAGEHGAFQPYRTGVIACGAYEVTKLEPGDRLSSQVMVVTNQYGRLAHSHLQYAGVELLPFSNPGKYWMRATYPLARSDSRETPPVLESSTIELIVKAASKYDEDALGFFGDPDEFAAAMGADGRISDIPSALRHWEKFVVEYPDSVYAPAVRLNLGTYYLNGTGLPQSDPGRAATHFQAVIAGSNQALAADAYVELTRSLIELGRIDDASATLRMFLERFPNSAHKSAAVRLRDGLNKGLRSLSEVYSK